MSSTTPIIIKTKTCQVCGNYELWSLDRGAVERWQAGELIQDAFPHMSIDDREIMISGTHPECWNKLFGEKEGEDE